MKKESIRNFSIIAHIDHGKSTLADRILESTGLIHKGMHYDQVLDSMELERERGITIKAQTVCMDYKAQDGKTYRLNLIDTPGHVDFAYEVSRALAACEGVLLVIDASQGVEAQTFANMYLALDHNLEIIPVINKIDLPSADIEGVKKQIKDDLGLDPSAAVCVSAKEGINIEEVLEAIVHFIPPPTGNPDDPLTMLIFDAQYDNYRGVITSCRMVDGEIAIGDEFKMFKSPSIYKVEELGTFRIQMEKTDRLSAGEVGYLISNIKNLKETKIGDTITRIDKPASKPLPGYKEVKPMVFSGVYPVDGDDYKLLGDALDKLKLNDASLIYEAETSAALGFGYRCGFLGLLHMDIISERLEREHDLELIFTAPSVEYEVHLKNKQTKIVDNPTHFPDPGLIDEAYEPFVKLEIILPNSYLGPVMNLIQEKRGIQGDMHYLDEKRVQLDCEMPLAEIVYDFHDRLKSISRGFASYDYFVIGYRKTDLVKVDILINAKKVDAFSQILHKDKAYKQGRTICEKLKEIIPPHMFQIPIQAAIGGNIIARTNIRSMRKNVTAKCYGGDITRKRKLLEKQKEGKKRMRQFGNVEIPKEAFIEVLKTDE